MTTNLRIQMKMDPHNPNWNYTPVSAEVINAKLEVEERLTIQGEKSVAVDPGFYLVRAFLPSGEIASAQVTVAPDQKDADVFIAASPSPHEFLAWQYFLGEIPSAGVPAFGVMPGGQPLPPTWIRLWRFDGRTWWPMRSAHWYRSYSSDPRFRFYEIGEGLLEPTTLYIAQVGGPNVPWRLVCIPPADRQLEILLRTSRLESSQNGGVVVKIVTGDRDSEILSHYLRSCSYDSARNIAGDFIPRVQQQDLEINGLLQDAPADVAETLLKDKRQNPYGAMIGGYYLLKVGDYDRMHNWPNNFANWFRWLPDAALIHAWQLFGLNGLSDLATARERLLQASRAGIPVFTEGVRYLIDGLELCVNAAQQRGETDPAAENALKDVRRYAGAMDWFQRLTTFYGSDPISPSLEPRTGTPADPNGNELVY